MNNFSKKQILKETGLLLAFLIFLVSEHYLMAGTLFGLYNIGALNFETFHVSSKSAVKGN